MFYLVHDKLNSLIWIGRWPRTTAEQYKSRVLTTGYYLPDDRTRTDIVPATLTLIALKHIYQK